MPSPRTPRSGPEAYAYRLTERPYGIRAGISYSPTAHSLLGCSFQRVDTHARGGNNYLSRYRRSPGTTVFK